MLKPLSSRTPTALLVEKHSHDLRASVKAPWKKTEEQEMLFPETKQLLKAMSALGLWNELKARNEFSNPPRSIAIQV